MTSVNQCMKLSQAVAGAGSLNFIDITLSVTLRHFCMQELDMKYILFRS